MNLQNTTMYVDVLVTTSYLNVTYITLKRIYSMKDYAIKNSVKYM